MPRYHEADKVFAPNSPSDTPLALNPYRRPIIESSNCRPSQTRAIPDCHRLRSGRRFLHTAAPGFEGKGGLCEVAVVIAPACYHNSQLYR
jgi:hypothetical protein